MPTVFSASGATTFGRDYKKYPWTIGYLPPYAEEGAAVCEAHPRDEREEGEDRACSTRATTTARIFSPASARGLGAKARKLIVQTVGYDPTASDVQSQVAQLKASGANTFAIFAFGKFAIQAFSVREQARLEAADLHQ